jgi:hypothetical protein
MGAARERRDCLDTECNMVKESASPAPMGSRGAIAGLASGRSRRVVFTVELATAAKLNHGLEPRATDDERKKEQPNGLRTGTSDSPARSDP